MELFPDPFRNQGEPLRLSPIRFVVNAAVKATAFVSWGAGASKNGGEAANFCEFYEFLILSLLLKSRLTLEFMIFLS